MATGKQFIFNSSYILEAPFLNGVLSSGKTLVPWGKIINGRFDCDMVFEISLKKPKLSLVVLFLLIEIDPIFFRYQPNIGICRSSFFRIKTG